jgi:hypothetical protein
MNSRPFNRARASAVAAFNRFSRVQAIYDFGAQPLQNLNHLNWYDASMFNL